jgi:hypothetical protein
VNRRSRVPQDVHEPVAGRGRAPGIGKKIGMSKPAKLVLGMLTLWPLIYVVCFLSFVLYVMINAASDQPDTVLMPHIAVLAVLHFGTMLCAVALLVVYVTDVFKNERVEKDKKVLWVLVLFCGSAIAMPIYWHLYIWPEPADESSGPATHSYWILPGAGITIKVRCPLL